MREDLNRLTALLDRNGIPTDLVRKTLDEHKTLGEKYRAALVHFDPKNVSSYQIVDQKVRGIDRAPTEKFDEIVEMVNAFETDSAIDREQAFIASNQKLFWVTSVFVFISVALAVVTGVYIGRSTSSRLRSFSSSLTSSSQYVGQAASQVESYSHDLANSISSEAAAIQEASASLQVLSDNSTRSSGFARKAAEVANSTRTAADQGKIHIASLEEAMSDIKESSDGISQILQSIDEIAFQTNILALNAAVEAARAGEAGAGFAVVADEVRALAQRCAKAAQNTSTRISDSVEKSKRGSEISQQVARSLEGILRNAGEVDALVSNIAQSVEENREGVVQVTRAIRSIEESSQSNAALTEESAAAAVELN